MKEYTAQLSNRGGRWRLYVELVDVQGAPWPEHDFGPAPIVPTMAERSRALTALGFVFTDDAEWAWTEHSEIHGDDTSPVLLLASVRVRSRDGGTP
ncbi:DUF6303 family protein [Streptomyces sp. NPDC079167]|uniref:DUF6303 family protein n=1 Tax=Streptomyces sp. NPDC079167 TaxID=3154513 RepID=UPI00341D194A